MLTFVSGTVFVFASLQMVDESALLDLKHLLLEAQQRVPPVLMALEDPDADMDEVRRVFCRVANFPLKALDSRLTTHFFFYALDNGDMQLVKRYKR